MLITIFLEPLSAYLSGSERIKVAIALSTASTRNEENVFKSINKSTSSLDQKILILPFLKKANNFIVEKHYLASREAIKKN